MRTTVRRSFVALSLALTVPWLELACRKRRPEDEVKVRFGVFFGGQVQEREEIPLVHDRTRLALGIRLEWREPPASPLNIRWELAHPANPKDASAGELAQYGEARTLPGSTILDVPLAFRPDDRPGPFVVRVDLEGKRVLDRAFRVVPPGAEVRPPEED